MKQRPYKPEIKPFDNFHPNINEKDCIKYLNELKRQHEETGKYGYIEYGDCWILVSQGITIAEVEELKRQMSKKKGIKPGDIRAEVINKIAE